MKGELQYHQNLAASRDYGPNTSRRIAAAMYMAEEIEAWQLARNELPGKP